MKQNKQVRIDALGAQASASANDPPAGINELNRLALVVIRKFIRQQRTEARTELNTVEEAAAVTKMERLKVKRDDDLFKKQRKFARMLIEYEVVPDTVADYDECMRETERGCIKRQEECIKQNYHAITSGWQYEAGITVADSTAGKQCELCYCGVCRRMEEGRAYGCTYLHVAIYRHAF